MSAPTPLWKRLCDVVVDAHLTNAPATDTVDKLVGLIACVDSAVDGTAEDCWDAEDCLACSLLEAQCGYHRGVTAGVAWFSEHLERIADDPEVLNKLATRAGDRINTGDRDVPEWTCRVDVSDAAAAAIADLVVDDANARGLGEPS